MSRYLILALRITVLAVCCWAIFAGQHPPVEAQAISAEDATQDANIASLNKHVENADANILRQESALNANAMAVAELQGEERVFFGLLTILTGVSIVIQVKRKAQ